ncbi:MAG: hypothetical protein AAFR52_16785 [Pseudomonadota bacterium]
MARPERDAYAWRNRGMLAAVFGLFLVGGVAWNNVALVLAGAGGLGWLAMVWWRRGGDG